MTFINQKGAGGMPVYYGARYQQGRGLGNMFKSFFRYIAPVVKTHGVPLLKTAADFVGSDAAAEVNSAANKAASIVKDVIEGTDVNNMVKEVAKDEIVNVQQPLAQPFNINRDKKRRKKTKRKKHNKKVKYNDVLSE